MNKLKSMLNGGSGIKSPVPRGVGADSRAHSLDETSSMCVLAQAARGDLGLKREL